LQNEDTEWISIYLGSFWKELDNRRYLKWQQRNRKIK
jgi:hypothetical protein